jgi:hypothetical protein
MSTGLAQYYVKANKAIEPGSVRLLASERFSAAQELDWSDWHS